MPHRRMFDTDFFTDVKSINVGGYPRPSCGCSSMVEFLPSKQIVVGSSPITRFGTIKYHYWPYSEVVNHAYLSSRNPGFEYSHAHWIINYPMSK